MIFNFPTLLTVTVLGTAVSAIGGIPVVLGWNEDGLAFHTDREKLIQEKPWIPDGRPLPVRLEALVAHARAEVVSADKLTNRVDLKSIHIRRISVPKRDRENAGLAPEDVTNKWYGPFRCNCLKESVALADRILVPFDRSTKADGAVCLHATRRHIRPTRWSIHSAGKGSTTVDLLVAVVHSVGAEAKMCCSSL